MGIRLADRKNMYRLVKGNVQTMTGTNVPGHRSRLDLYWPKKRDLPCHENPKNVLGEGHHRGVYNH